MEVSRSNFINFSLIKLFKFEYALTQSLRIFSSYSHWAISITSSDFELIVKISGRISFLKFYFCEESKLFKFA
jgi:hypothetical protein